MNIIMQNYVSAHCFPVRPF
uniref:Uncharacterized protein n=1 Tax=Anguilla anguilla TaxID=7936 RepID=A0A0E9R4G1_ANGAN